MCLQILKNHVYFFKMLIWCFSVKYNNLKRLLPVSTSNQNWLELVQTGSFANPADRWLPAWGYLPGADMWLPAWGR